MPLDVRKIGNLECWLIGLIRIGKYLLLKEKLLDAYSGV
jgi:hypothetical protein